jgi:hypothetical protein
MRSRPQRPLSSSVMPLLKASATFTLGIATALLFPMLAYGILVAFVPVGNATTPSVLIVCAAFIAMSSFLALVGFLGGAYVCNYTGNRAGHVGLGVASGFIALALFIPAFLTVGTGSGQLACLVIVFFTAGFAASCRA